MHRPTPDCRHLVRPRQDGQLASCRAIGDRTVLDASCRDCPQDTRREPLAWPLRTSHAPITGRDAGMAGLENLYLGGQLFLVLSGPSLLELDISLLYQRGVVMMAVNNAAAIVRPHLWTHGDQPGKFHDAIWRDPGVLKLIPSSWLSSPIRSRDDAGALVNSPVSPQDVAGVWSVRRNNSFSPDKWLWEDTINWGNGKRAAKTNGLPIVHSTMLQALRLAFYLGFRTVYLLGCDFSMSANYRYAFPERRSQGAVDSNNADYGKLAKLLEMLRPEFDANGFEVLNCNPRSNLFVFDYLPFEAALVNATAGVDQEPDTVGWYES